MDDQFFSISHIHLKNKFITCSCGCSTASPLLLLEGMVYIFFYNTRNTLRILNNYEKKINSLQDHAHCCHLEKTTSQKLFIQNMKRILAWCI